MPQHMEPKLIAPRSPLHTSISSSLLEIATNTYQSTREYLLKNQPLSPSFQPQKHSQNFCPNFSHSEFCGKGVHTQSSPSPSIGVSSSPSARCLSDTSEKTDEADETWRVASRSRCSLSSDAGSAWSFGSARSRIYVSCGTSQNASADRGKVKVVLCAGVLRVHLLTYQICSLLICQSIRTFGTSHTCESRRLLSYSRKSRSWIRDVLCLEMCWSGGRFRDVYQIGNVD